ncbi:MAG: hypothetical protein ACE5E1_01555, partial [Phycisphaerae bacterium]
MRCSVRCVMVMSPIAAWGLFSAATARGEVLEIRGSATARVVQFDGSAPAQSDFSQVMVPQTQPNPPAVASARLDAFDNLGGETAAGQVVAIFELPNLMGLGPPNDVGLDAGAFSDDDHTSWFVEGIAEEKRTIVLQTVDAIGDLVGDEITRARSRILLSGALVVTSAVVDKDLSGVEAAVSIRVDRFVVGMPTETLVDGTVRLTGGPGGAVTISQTSGVFDGVFLPVVDFRDTISGLPLVQAVLFTGLELPYEYEFTPDEPFDLALTASVQVRAIPGGTGAAAVFGVPQDGLGSVLQRVKQDDRGREVERLIAERV